MEARDEFTDRRSGSRSNARDPAGRREFAADQAGARGASIGKAGSLRAVIACGGTSRVAVPAAISDRGCLANAARHPLSVLIGARLVPRGRLAPSSGNQRNSGPFAMHPLDGPAGIRLSRVFCSAALAATKGSAGAGQYRAETIVREMTVPVSTGASCSVCGTRVAEPPLTWMLETDARRGSLWVCNSCAREPACHRIQARPGLVVKSAASVRTVGREP